MKEARLPDCPPTPNCVCTQASEERHQMAPIPFSGSAEEAMAAIQSALSSIPRTQVTEESPHRLRAECRSALFRFVDDVDFLIDPEAKLIHFRSASRVGHSDLGVNRRRMERVVAAIESGK